jgi:hypothetical protein
MWTFAGSSGSAVTLTISATTDWGGSLGANDAGLTVVDPSGGSVGTVGDEVHLSVTRRSGSRSPTGSPKADQSGQQP